MISIHICFPGRWGINRCKRGAEIPPLRLSGSPYLCKSVEATNNATFAS